MRRLIYPLFSHMHSFPIINVMHQNATFFPSSKDESTLTHHNHPKPIIYLKVYPCFCTLYGFGQMHITHIYHPLIAQLVKAEDPCSILGSGRSAGEGICYPLQYSLAFLVAQLVKNLPAVQETWVQSLSLEGPLEKKTATHSSTLAWRIPWTV